MINSIKITDLSEADNIARGLKETNCNAWICTIDENDTERGYGIKNLFEKRNIPCYLDFFYDIDDEALGTIDNFEIIKSIPREDNIRKIMNFIQNLVSSDEQYNVGINCFAGVSRSTAIGIFAWVLQGLSPKDALDKILEVRWMAYPNTRILRIASEICEVDILSTVNNWLKESKGLYIPSGGWKW
jgi:hypothetical protein